MKLEAVARAHCVELGNEEGIEGVVQDQAWFFPIRSGPDLNRFQNCNGRIQQTIAPFKWHTRSAFRMVSTFCMGGGTLFSPPSGHLLANLGGLQHVVQMFFHLNQV